MNNEVKTRNKNNIVVFILIFLLLLSLSYIGYDKLIKKNDNTIQENNQNKEEKEQQDSDSLEKITTIKRIQITDVDQIANVDGKEFKIKKEVSVDGAFLLIDDAIQYVADMETAYAEYAYVTNKYIIFTVTAQDWETITYAIDKNGNQVLVDDVNKDKNEKGEDTRAYQIHDLKIVDDKLQAIGHIFCGLDGDCQDIDLIINYENNTIIVSPK